MTKREMLQHQWNQRIGEYRASGLTLKAWCGSHDCTVDQMKYWLYKSNRKTTASKPDAATSSPAARFVPLKVAEEKAAPLVLRVGAVQIDVQRSFDATLLREVVQALAEMKTC